MWREGERRRRAGAAGQMTKRSPVRSEIGDTGPAARIASLYAEEGLSTRVLRGFRSLIRGHYRTHGRIQPWRETDDPFAVLVSEIMLQQTQVERVTEKYTAFLREFPDFPSLARAPLRKVLALWQGLGYNRRAVSLHRLAKTVVEQHGAALPSDEKTLVSLPGIGHYTANAVRAFAFNLPGVFIETNIRRVFLHIFFQDSEGVRDSSLLPLIDKTLDRKNPRTWYYGLMDYGAELRRNIANPNRRSRHYARQPAFEGSRRQMRAKVLRSVLASGRSTAASVASKAELKPGLARELLEELASEGFLEKSKGRYVVPGA